MLYTINTHRRAQNVLNTSLLNPKLHTPVKIKDYRIIVQKKTYTDKKKTRQQFKQTR